MVEDCVLAVRSVQLCLVLQQRELAAAMRVFFLCVSLLAGKVCHYTYYTQ